MKILAIMMIATYICKTLPRILRKTAEEMKDIENFR
jgi:hypothetical protein